ncbi:hypothetical protein CHU_1548 [Sporocytophaga myxococcoides]|uniref:DUF4340 domain-containing protein n=1 Tax=Sporocytophaga myxococcoides TaxID=153721 RepID=A0A098LDH4_9BACT|nr:hypothetical protein [Sporocytophaga myxococcoides]GAL84985.1 hypothetical protein CHU_1548 [Sporocytophaga myxococcoides]
MRELKKLSPYIFLFVITGLAALYTLLGGSGSDSFNNEKLSVGVADTTAITSVSFQVNNQTTNLQKKANGKWSVNNKYDAREKLISLLFFGLNKIEVKRPVADNKKTEVVKKLKQDGVKISVESSGEKNVFYVMSNENDVNSTYFLSESSSDPVIVFVPGVKGDLSELASLKEQDWRSRILFNSSPRSLQKVSVSFPAAPSENFTIVSRGNKFEVENLPLQDSSKIHRYLMLYGVTNVDKYIVDGKDTIVNQLHKAKPFSTIQVDDIVDNLSKTVDIYLDPWKQGKIYALIRNTGELITLNPELTNYLLVKKSFFAPSNK